MFTKKERLTSKDFSRFFSSGKRFHSTFFTVVYTPYPTTHVSVVVPKKVARRAVQRNSLRRQVYDILRRYLKSDNKTGIFIVLMKKPSIEVEYAILKNNMYKRLKSIL